MWITSLPMAMDAPPPNLHKEAARELFPFRLSHPPRPPLSPCTTLSKERNALIIVVSVILSRHFNCHIVLAPSAASLGEFCDSVRVHLIYLLASFPNQSKRGSTSHSSDAPLSLRSRLEYETAQLSNAL
jgi:hypothetical protein